jgi:hypothetical protein
MKLKIIANIDFCTLQQATVVGVVKKDMNPTFGDKGGQFWRILLRMCIIICVCCESGGVVWIGKNSSQTGRKGGVGGSTHLGGVVEVDSSLCAARWIRAADSGRRWLRLCLVRAFDSAREWRLRLHVSLCVGNGGFDFARRAGMNAARGSDRRGRKGGLTRWMGETSGGCGGEIFSSDRRWGCAWCARC